MTDRIDSERLEQAVGWRIRVAESPELHTEALAAWVAQDPLNRKAWQAAQASWEFLGEHATSPSVVGLRRTALAYASKAVRNQTAFAPLRRLPTWVATAAVILIVVSAATAWYLQRADTYRTAFGERRIVTLTDGSQITLDSSSEVTVRYGANARALTLVSGQARFDVTHDVERPFTVTAHGRRVVAMGTAFDVDLLGSDFRVTLIEGRVVVLPPSKNVEAAEQPSVAPARSSGITLDAGQQLVVSSHAAPRVTPVDIDRVMAWERGKIVFNNEPLASVVERMNRYTSRRIEVADERISDLRISGVFHVGDVSGFVGTLISYLPVKVEQHPDGSLLMTYQDSGAAP